MGKRGNQEGTITKRKDGRWEARLSLPNGRRKSFYGKTRQEVARQLTQAQQGLQTGLPVVSDRQTVEQYLLSWLEVMKSQVRFSSWRRYNDVVSLHINPVLGKTHLSKLLPQQIQLLYTQKLQEGLSPTTVRSIHLRLHHALKDALRLGLVAFNVSEKVSPPRAAPHEIQTLSEDQARLPPLVSALKRSMCWR